MEFQKMKNEKKMETEIQESESPIQALPDDVILAHIIPRLPIEHLMRFKCVSKTMFSEISTSQFAKSHLNSSSSSSSSPHQFLLFSGNNIPLFTSFTLDYHRRIAETMKLGFTNNEDGPIQVVGCYNNLVCFADQHFKFTICNPVTQQCTEIPANVDLDPITLITAGFSYVSSVDDYKIACFMRACVYIFSLRTWKWEKLSSLANDLAISRSDVPVLIDDTLYWYARNVNNVVGVNLVNGELRIIPSPFMIDFYPSFQRVKLYRGKGRLSLWCSGTYIFGREEELCDGQVWILNEDCLSWMKLYDLSCESLRLLCVCETTGKWLVLIRGSLGLFDPSTRQYQGGISFNGPISSAWNFKMSLVLPTLV